MKSPKFAAFTARQQIDIGINYFAVTLLAESFSLRRDELGNESLCVRGMGRDGKPVYTVISSVPPEIPGEEAADASP